MLEPVKSKKIYENIVEQIKEMIIKGRLKIGNRLPSERELAENLKVSRTSVREALRILENMGLIECRSGDGNFVKDLTIDSLANSIALRIPLQRGTILQLFELRKIIEPGIVRLAVERVTDADIVKMDEIIEKQRKLVDNGQNIFETDNSFHHAIAKASRNNMILKIINTIVELQNESQELDIEVRERPKESLKSHINILKYLKIRDKEKARKAMLTHLTTVERLIKKKLGES